jgi:ABC-type branched-subunit amino acid transport system ATPase component/ABC-type branched-subunit amino acid transport system permease subunit
MSGAGSLMTLPLTGDLRFADNNYEVFNAELLLIYLIAVFGLSHMLNAGLVSIGHSAMVGVGAYAMGLSLDHGRSFWEGLVLAAVVTTLLGVPLGYPALRLGHWTLAMVTFAYTLVFQDVVNGARDITNGEDGLVGIGRPSEFKTLGSYYWLIVIGVVLAYVVSHNVTRSPTGRRVRAVAASETASTSVGINPRSTKLTAFVLGSLFAGVAGALYASLLGYITPTAFVSDLSLLFLLMVLLGGSGSLAGPIIGAILLFRIPLEVQRITPKAGEWTLIIYGSILLASVYLFPRGIVSGWWRLRSRFVHKAPIAERTADEHSLASIIARPVEDSNAPLRASEVRVALGGNQVLRGLDIELQYGQVHGLIGPNGSGKTTFLNVLCGYLTPDAGTSYLFGTPVSENRPDQRAAAGLARTFQTPLLFEKLSCLENVMVALDATERRNAFEYLVRLPPARRAERETYERGERILAAVGLERRAHDAAGDLPPGERRLLELARIVAIKPRVVLMDEPASGLNESEIDNLVRMIMTLRQSGLAVLVVEHHVELVREVCDKITVIDAGSLLAEGAPGEVLANPLVVSTYLGVLPATTIAGD